MTNHSLTLSLVPRGRSAASNFVELYKHVKQGIGYRVQGIGVEEDYGCEEIVSTFPIPYT